MIEIEKHLQAAFPEAVIHIGKKLTNEEWLALGSPLPFVIIGETEDVVALHSFSVTDLILVDKVTGDVKIGKGTVELGKFLLIYQHCSHFLYSHLEFDEKAKTATLQTVIVKEPTIAPEKVDQVVKRTRRKKVVKDDSCKEALAVLFPDFEIETNAEGISFILAECSLYDATEHLVEMGCEVLFEADCENNSDQYTFATEKQLFNVQYEQLEDSQGFKVWLSLRL